MTAPEATPAWLGLGANLGDAVTTLGWALEQLHTRPGLQVQRISSLYRSAPIDASGPDYVNAVAQVATTLAPQALLEALQALEQAAGRERPYRNAPRTLDLDILWFGQQHISTNTLTVPHPRIYERAFVLLPLVELVPERISAAQLQRVQDQRIERIEHARWRVPSGGAERG